MPTHVDLFSGIGGFALAAKWAGFKTVCFVELDEYCQKILQKNFRAVADAKKSNDKTNNQEGGLQIEFRGSYPRIHSDIRTFDGTAYRGATLLTGGFPCQPFSQAGKRRGKEDNRYLWPEMYRVIRESQPAWVVAENVAGIVQMELDSVLSDLEGEDYECQTFVIPACAVDARHRRDRVWIVGHAAHAERRPSEQRRGDIKQGNNGAGQAASELGEPSQDVADDSFSRQTDIQGCTTHGFMDGPGRISRNGRAGREHAQWFPEPDVGRVAHGIPHRVDRLKGLGNSIVPQVAYEIIKAIGEIEK